MKKFTENMYSTISRLNNESNVMLTKCSDTLCSKCPNRLSDKCKDEEKIQFFDNNALKECGLSEGQIINWVKARDIAKDQILKKGIIQDVCAGCGWSSICYKKAGEII